MPRTFVTGTSCVTVRSNRIHPRTIPIVPREYRSGLVTRSKVAGRISCDPLNIFQCLGIISVAKISSDIALGGV